MHKIPVHKIIIYLFLSFISHACGFNKQELPIQSALNLDPPSNIAPSKSKNLEDSYTEGPASSYETDAQTLPSPHNHPTTTRLAIKQTTLEEEKEEITIVGFPGLTDKEGPTSLIRMITKLPGINEFPIMILRKEENEETYTHAQRAYDELLQKGMANKSIVFVGESYGVLVAYATALYNKMRAEYHLNLTPGKELNIKGIVSVHGPWAGVSPVSGLLSRYHQLERLGFYRLIHKCFEKFNISAYMIPKPLEALDPNEAFLKTIKRTLRQAEYPILALAGLNEGIFGISAYDKFRDAYNTSLWKKTILYYIFRISPSFIIEEYEKGNDGLITTASAFAAGIPKNDHFTTAQAEAPHIHSDFSLYPELVKAVSTFIQRKILPPSAQPATVGRIMPNAFIAPNGFVYFKNYVDEEGKPIPVPRYKMVVPNLPQ